MYEEIINEIIELFDNKKYNDVKKLLADMQPADLASIFDELDVKEVPVFFRLLPKELAAETFTYMDPDDQRRLLEAFSDKELRAVLSEIFVDDTVDLIEEMPANVVGRILKNTDPDTRKQINQILKYPENSAGTIMTTEFVYLRKEMTIEDAFDRIRKVGVDKETVYTCYVTQNRTLIGIVTVKDMLLTSFNRKIGEIMETNVISANVYDDKEAVAAMFSHYNLLAIPVVDNEGRIVGIVTVDDAIDVIEEETTEDIEKMAALVPSDKPYLKTGVFETWKLRTPWLLILMVSATFTGAIISSFESNLAAIPVLTAFIPMLMDTGGNAGGQASVTIIRSLALSDISFSDIFRIQWKEMRVSVLCGITVAVACFAKLFLVDKLILQNDITVYIALVVSLTLFCTIFFAKLVGCSLPLLAKKLGFDPAVMASPFITTIIDVISLFTYFKIATVLLY